MFKKIDTQKRKFCKRAVVLKNEQIRTCMQEIKGILNRTKLLFMGQIQHVNFLIAQLTNKEHLLRNVSLKISTRWHHFINYYFLIEDLL